MNKKSTKGRKSSSIEEQRRTRSSSRRKSSSPVRIITKKEIPKRSSSRRKSSSPVKIITKKEIPKRSQSSSRKRSPSPVKRVLRKESPSPIRKAIPSRKITTPRKESPSPIRRSLSTKEPLRRSTSRKESLSPTRRNVSIKEPLRRTTSRKESPPPMKKAITPKESPPSIKKVTSSRKTTRSLSPEEKKSIPVRRDILEEPKYIEGPVNFIYVSGDPGDGVTRKILLLGDFHNPAIACPPASHVGENISVANFCRYVANRMTPRVIDIFIEWFYDSTGPRFFLPEEEKKGKYLDNLRFTFRKCLKKDKSLCNEPMRIHYSDPRLLMKSKELYSFHIIDAFLTSVLDPRDIFEGGIWDQVRWPQEKEIEHIAKLTLEDARLTDAKFQSLDSSIRQKFKDVVIAPILQKIISFYRNTSNRDLLKQIKAIKANVIKTKVPLTMDQLVLINGFKFDIVFVKAPLLDAYFVYRLLKRATTAHEPALPKLALQPGEPTTHVIGYLGAMHTFGVRDILYRLGFEISKQEDKNRLEIAIKTKVPSRNIVQCLAYSSIKKSVDNFCAEETEDV